MRRLFLLAGLVLGSWAGFSHGVRDRGVDAGTAVRLGISEMVECADLVLEGRVRSCQVEEVSPRRIETVVTLDVDRTFWGEDLALRSIRLPGGVLEDGRGLVISGMPTVQAGEEVLMFLSEEGSSRVRVPVGLSQGKLRVETSLDGRRVLSRDPGELLVVDPTGGAVRHAASHEHLDYAGVVADIWAAVDRRRLGSTRREGRGR